MEDSIQQKLVAKCSELAEKKTVRTRNIVAWLTKDVDNRLLPVMMGDFDIRRIPFCGRTTSSHIEQIVDELWNYYKTIEPGADVMMQDKQTTMETTTSNEFFTFEPTAKDDILQATFEKMTLALSDTRAKNLIHVHLKHYTHSQSFINEPSLIWNWYGAGRHTVATIQQFLEDFKQQYIEIVNTSTSALPDTVVALDYPFLAAEEITFVRRFYAAHNRYPVWYIASRFFNYSSDKAARIFAQVNGINVKRTHAHFVAQQLGLTSERVRQLSKNVAAIRKLAPTVWDQQRWAQTPAYSLDIITEKLIDWKHICKLEKLNSVDFQAALAILSVARPITIIALHKDGTTTNSHANSAASRIKPYMVFAYGSSLNYFNFDSCLRLIGHHAALKKIYDQSFSLDEITQDFFLQEVSPEQKQTIYDKLSIVLPLFPDVVIQDNKLILQVNRLNYFKEIYLILQRKRKPMTVDEIYGEFKLLHPDDPHTESGFIRSYMLQDKRFQAVGRKSTYQLREWEQFAGSLSDLAVGILKDETAPMIQTLLCKKMMEQRPNSTLKSCHTSVYLAVKAGSLQFFMKDNKRIGANFVGVANHDYGPSFQAFKPKSRKRKDK